MTRYDFADLRAANLLRSGEWQSSEEFGAMFFAVATGGECGEALNVMKKLERGRIDAKSRAGVYPTTATINDLANEMADTIIYMDLWAQSIGIDLWRAVVAKFNAKSVEMGFSTKLEE